MTENIGVKYRTQIPSLNSNADIQNALTLYHYGQETEPSTLIPNSIAGHLDNLENTKVDVIPSQIVAGSQNDLNLKVTTGYYSCATNSIASAGQNYPPSATAGLLQVMNDGSGIIYQIYVMTGTQYKLFWRGFYASAWSSWVQASDSGHTHAEFSSIAGQIATLTSGLATTDGKVTALESSRIIQALGNKSVGTPIPAGTKKLVIARDNGSGVPDISSYTPAEADIWMW